MEDMIRLCVVTPTVGRATLERAMRSVRKQLSGFDALLVYHDGVGYRENIYAGQTRTGGWIIQMGSAHCHFDVGGTPRNEMILWLFSQVRRGPKEMRGDWYFMFLDDDDVFTEDALQTVRESVGQAPGVPHIFRMQYADGGILWTEPVLRPGNVGSPMFVCPAVPGKVGWWDGERVQDYRFIYETVGYHGGRSSIVWHEDVICQVRPR